MNRKSVIIAYIILACAPVMAQTQDGGMSTAALADIYMHEEAKSEQSYQEQRNVLTEFNGNFAIPDNDKKTALSDISPERYDSLYLPPLNSYGRMRLCSYPGNRGGLYDWDLHEGLNVNLGMSVFATFGKHVNGAGFGQSLSAMYAMPLTDKLSLAVGGYFNNMYWVHNSYHDAGFSAVLGYKFNEHWEGYLYAQKSITTPRMPMPLYDINDIGDRIGAAVRYNVNQNVSIQVSVSAGEVNIPKPREHKSRP